MERRVVPLAHEDHVLELKHPTLYASDPHAQPPTAVQGPVLPYLSVET